MDELNRQFRPVYKVSFVTMGACAVCWAIFPDVRSIPAGLLLGIAASLLNFWYLGLKVSQFADGLLNKKARRTSLGFLTRASVAVLVVGLAMKTPHLNWIAALAGLFFTQLATLLLGVLSYFHKTKQG